MADSNDLKFDLSFEEDLRLLEIQRNREEASYIEKDVESVGFGESGPVEHKVLVGNRLPAGDNDPWHDNTTRAREDGSIMSFEAVSMLQHHREVRGYEDNLSDDPAEFW